MPGFFICYRRDDTAGYAGRMYDWLVARFGPKLVFMDVDALAPGEDFVSAVEARISASDVMLVVIGRNWLDTVDGLPHRRLENPGDYVRLEILHALDNGLRLIPVLVDGASMPGFDDFPDALVRLSRCNAWTLTPGGFPDQMRRLLDMLAKEKIEAERREAERREREAEERRMRILAAREVAAESPKVLKPYNYPLWVQFFCAAIFTSAFLSISTAPKYLELATQLNRAKAAYVQRDYYQAIGRAEDVLRSAPTSKEAKLTVAKSCFQLKDSEHLKMGVKVLRGLQIHRSEWAQIAPLLPPEYRALFKETK